MFLETTMFSELSPNCSEGVLEEIRDSFRLKEEIPQIVQASLAVIAFFCNIGFMLYFHKCYVEKNFRVLMVFNQVFSLIHSSFFGANQIYHIVLRRLASDCDLLVPVSKCLLIRLPQSIAVTFYQLFFVSVMINAMLNCISKKYSKSSVGGVLALFATGLAILFTIPSFFADKDSRDFMINCSSFEHKSSAIQRNITVGFLIIDMLMILILFAITVFLSRKLKAPGIKNSKEAYNRLELFQRTWWLILPSLLLNAFCYFATFGGLCFLDPIQSKHFLWINTIPLYTCISPIIWMIFLRDFGYRKPPPAPEHSEERNQQVFEMRIMIDREKEQRVRREHMKNTTKKFKWLRRMMTSLRKRIPCCGDPNVIRVKAFDSSPIENDRESRFKRVSRICFHPGGRVNTTTASVEDRGRRAFSLTSVG